MLAGVDCNILRDVASDTGLHVLTRFVVGDPLAEFRVLTEYDASTLHTYDRLYVAARAGAATLEPLAIRHHSAPIDQHMLAAFDGNRGGPSAPVADAVHCEHRTGVGRGDHNAV